MSLLTTRAAAGFGTAVRPVHPLRNPAQADSRVMANEVA